VLPVAGWFVLRAFGLEEGYPMVPLLAYTPLAVAGGVAVFVIALLLRRRGLVSAVYARVPLVRAPIAAGQTVTAARLRVIDVPGSDHRAVLAELVLPRG